MVAVDAPGASTVISLLSDALTSLLPDGHAPRCPHGQWTSKYLPLRGYPDGSPCSKRCKTIAVARETARQWLLLRMEAGL